MYDLPCRLAVFHSVQHTFAERTAEDLRTCVNKDSMFVCNEDALCTLSVGE